MTALIVVSFQKSHQNKNTQFLNQIPYYFFFIIHSSTIPFTFRMCNRRHQNSYTQRPRTPKIIIIKKKERETEQKKTQFNDIAQIKEKYGMYTTTPYAHNYNSHVRYVGF